MGCLIATSGQHCRVRFIATISGNPMGCKRRDLAVYRNLVCHALRILISHGERVARPPSVV
jgi:hypothetical protein